MIVSLLLVHCPFKASKRDQSISLWFCSCTVCKHYRLWL